MDEQKYRKEIESNIYKTVSRPMTYEAEKRPKTARTKRVLEAAEGKSL